nr:copper resistance CopC family protein [Microbacterium halimionae]
MFASPAAAHDELVATDPVADSTLDEMPTELTLSFSSELINDGNSTVVEVTDGAGTDLTGGDPEVTGEVVRQPLSGEASGDVTVLWRVVSSDGHPISGEFRFTVTAQPTSSPRATTPAPEASVPAESATPETSVSESSTPSATDTAPTSSSFVPWIIVGVLLLAAVVATVVVIVSRRRPSKSSER